MVKKEYFVTALIAAVVSSLVTGGIIIIFSAPSSPISISSVAKPHFSIVDIEWDSESRNPQLRISIMNDGDADATNVSTSYVWIIYEYKNETEKFYRGSYAGYYYGSVGFSSPLSFHFTDNEFKFPKDAVDIMSFLWPSSLPVGAEAVWLEMNITCSEGVTQQFLITTP